MTYEKVINNIKPHVKEVKGNYEEIKDIDKKLEAVEIDITDFTDLGEAGESELSRAKNKKASLNNQKEKLENKSKNEFDLAKKKIKEVKKEYVSKIAECTEELNLREETIQRCKAQMLTLKQDIKDGKTNKTKKYKATNEYVKKVIEEKKDIARNRTKAINDFKDIKPKLEKLEGLLDVSKLSELEAEIDSVRTPVSTPSKPVSTPSKPVSTPSIPVSTPSKPVSTPSIPVSTPSKPVSTPSIPVSTPSIPVSTPSKPVSTPSIPVSTPSIPVSTPSKPVSTPSIPVSTPSIPVSTPSKPVSTPSKPVSTPSKPVSTPSIPVSTPSIPVSTPSKPVSTPSIPVSTPSKPVSTPSIPVSTPSIPVSTPSIPVSTPSKPVSTPSIPVSTPSKPVSTPSIPVSTPSKPVSTPSKPVSTPSMPVSTPSKPVINPVVKCNPKLFSADHKKISFIANGENGDSKYSIYKGEGEFGTRWTVNLTDSAYMIDDDNKIYYLGNDGINVIQNFGENEKFKVFDRKLRRQYELAKKIDSDTYDLDCIIIDGIWYSFNSEDNLFKSVLDESKTITREQADILLKESFGPDLSKIKDIIDQMKSGKLMEIPNRVIEEYILEKQPIELDEIRVKPGENRNIEVQALEATEPNEELDDSGLAYTVEGDYKAIADKKGFDLNIYNFLSILGDEGRIDPELCKKYEEALENGQQLPFIINYELKDLYSQTDLTHKEIKNLYKLAKEAKKVLKENVHVDKDNILERALGRMGRFFRSSTNRLKTLLPGNKKELLEEGSTKEKESEKKPIVPTYSQEVQDMGAEIRKCETPEQLADFRRARIEGNDKLSEDDKAYLENIIKTKETDIRTPVELNKGKPKGKEPEGKEPEGEDLPF